MKKTTELNIDFIKYTPWYFLLSGLVIAVGIFSLLRWGLRPAVDFVGGSLIQVKIVPKKDVRVGEDSIRDALSSGSIEAHSIQSAGPDQWVVRTKSGGEDTRSRVESALNDKLGETEIVRFETVGPTLGRELLIKTLVAVVIASGGILSYVAWRFRGGKYGICAVLAMLHDSLVLIGSFSLLGHFYGLEADTLFVTAVLTILSFSVHDTVVVYDRIRENLRRFPQDGYLEIVNRSINETLGRSINNSLTIIFMLIALTALGGDTIRPFALALLIGTITGTYSSTFTAAPLLVVWDRIGSWHKGRDKRGNKR